jgi:hypothetical protein
MRPDNKYYLVRNMTASGGGVEIASGIVPVTSPTLFTSGDITEGTYKIMRAPEGVQLPTGAKVMELTIDEAKLAVQSDVFTGSQPTVDFIGLEQETAQILRRSFMAAQSTLPIAQAELLFKALEPTSHALSAGSLNIAYFRFNNAPVEQSTKDMFNPLFESFFCKFPRDLT